MENPLKRLRLELRYTPDQFAKVAGITLAAVGQAEEGFYTNPLPALLSVLGIKPGSPQEKNLIEEYHAYQVEKRRSNGPATNHSRLTLSPQFKLDEHPLLTWRKQSGLSTYGFCSAFCVHMPSVNNFEKNITAISQNPPSSILLPLVQAGFGLTDVLDEFTEACVLHKAALLNHLRTLNNLKLESLASAS